MQTPKARTSSSEVPRKVSPRASSSEVPRKVSPRVSSLEVPPKISPRTVSSKGPQKVSPRVVRQLKTTAQDSDSTSSSNRTCRTPKDNSPKITEHRAPRSPVCEKKRPSRVAELESQISQLESDLEKVKDRLCSSEAWRKQALQDAEELKKQLLAMSLELEESQKQLSKQSASEEPQTIELQKASEQQDQKLFSEHESIQKQHSVDSAALASAINEIKEVKFQLEKVTESEVSQTKHAELAQSELHSLKEKLAETLVLMEDVKDQLRNCKESEAHAQALVAETLMQLETAKRTVEMLRSDGVKSMEAYDAIASELEQSRARVNLLEELVNKLKAAEGHVVSYDSQASAHDRLDLGNDENGKSWDSSERSANGIDAELHSVKSEVYQLRSALEAAEIRYNGEQTRNAVEIRNAHELVEQLKSTSSQRETELEMELKKSKTEIEELKADLMDKETELQGICEENEFLNMRLKNVLSGQREYDLEKDLEKSRADIENFKANLMDKETELQNISEENEMLKLEIKKPEIKRGKVSEEVGVEVEAARVAEQEAVMKVGYMTENVDKSNMKVTRVSEQLEAAQAANSELEAELRRLKVQADQWRRAAETAAAMLSSGNNGKYVERTGSMDSHYSPKSGKINLPYSEDVDEDLLKRKNTNMLQKLGVFRKKPQK